LAGALVTLAGPDSFGCPDGAATTEAPDFAAVDEAAVPAVV
jgi:hypothetical protein